MPGVGLTFEPGVAGCDEAGRGALAGPIVCAAVVLPSGFDLTLLADSKSLSPQARREAATVVQGHAVWSVQVVTLHEIETLNVLWASMDGMARALEHLSERPRSAWIDGPHVPVRRSVPCFPMVKGDAKNAAVAAASIVAKVTRDEIMVRLDQEHPGYGLANHFGYGTPEHLKALERLGPSPVHRRTFAPVARMEQLKLDLGAV
jgi:ribonuclease HII